MSIKNAQQLRTKHINCKQKGIKNVALTIRNKIESFLEIVELFGLAFLAKLRVPLLYHLVTYQLYFGGKEVSS